MTSIDACVLGDLRTLIRGIDAYHASADHLTADGRPTGSANFLLVAGCCSAIDYLAHIYASRGSRRSEGDSLHRHFPRANQSALRRGWPPDLEVLSTRDRAPQLAETHRVGGRHSGGDHGRRQRGFGSAPVSVARAGSRFALINGRQLLSDLTRAFDDRLRRWILTDASADALERAKPQDLRVGGGDIGLQVEAVRRWNAEDRLPYV